MKKGNLEKWTNLEDCKNLLFFSELVGELLFDYSIPSNRISTLNSHYLCLDALNAIDGIDDHGVPEGTLKPIAEELYLSLQKDLSFDSSKDNPLKYFVKYQGDRYRISTNVSELNYTELKKAIIAIHTHFFTDDKYYISIKEKICQIVKENKETEQPALFRLVKSLLTELINTGYSSQYIYDIMSQMFWVPECEISDSTIIDKFFELFTFNRNDYQVVFIVEKKQIGKLVEHIEDLTIEETLSPKTDIASEQAFLTKSKKKVFLLIRKKALDPYSAAVSAKFTLEVNTSFYRLCNHFYSYDINKTKCGVYSGNNFFAIRENVNAVSHTKMPSKLRISESMAVSEKALESVRSTHSINDYIAVINAARFHAQALNSDSLENQLLDLWAIFEAVLAISNKHTSDRIMQICMYLVPILKRRYVYSLFAQLSNDIRSYSEEAFIKIVGADGSEKDNVENVCAFVLLDELENDRQEFLSKCQDFPLLKERIEYYRQMLSKPVDVYNFVEKHAERVKWQVMRIYRNRNLIIHNGESMPYLALLIENLHSYVDDFLTYVLHSLSEEHDINSMCQVLFAKECEWLADFSDKKAVMNKERIREMLSM